MAKPAFVRNLGKLAIADVLIGNQDRFSVVMQRGKAAATFNSANFKIWGDGMVGAFDHDTVAFSQELFEQKTGNVDANAWVNTIIGGESFAGVKVAEFDRPMPSLGDSSPTLGRRRCTTSSSRRSR